MNNIHSGGSCALLGNAETYLATAWNNGRTSGKLTFERNRCDFPGFTTVNYKGDHYGHTATFYSDRIEVSFTIDDNAFATGTYNGSSWSYTVL